MIDELDLSLKENQRKLVAIVLENLKSIVALTNRQQALLNKVSELELEVAQLKKQPQAKPTLDKKIPKKINTNALKTLYDNLDQNEALALEIDACIRDNKKDGWVGHNQKEKNLKIALRKIINDEGLLENIFNLAKHIDEYH
ncbi:hypothetical protein ID0205_03740 [Helicobacter pylori]